MARFVLSKSKVLEQLKAVRELSDSVSYSVKTNLEVAKVLEKESDCYFSVHSISELQNIKDKERVWYFAQGWAGEDLLRVFEAGVAKFVVDNQNDLRLLLSFINVRGLNIDLLLRMRLKERTIHTGKHFVYGMFSAEINDLIPKLRQNSNIHVLGIHFHRKTQNVSEWSLKYELGASLKEETLRCLDIVNIGGGIPAKYKNFRAEVLKYIFGKIKELKEWLKDLNIKVIIEPGRFIAAPAVRLEANIVNVYDNNIIVDCSVYNSAMDTFIAHSRLLIEGELEKGRSYTVKGCTPDSADIFRYSVYLDNPKVGDKIVFLNAGAYNYCTDFCDLPKLETVVEE